MIRDYKHLMVLQHIHMEQMLLKYVKQLPEYLNIK